MRRPPSPWLLALLALALPTLPLAPPAAAAGLADGGRATVGEIIDGDTLVLADGRQVRLVGIAAPKLPLGRPDAAPWPLADAAKAALAELTLGKEVTLGYGGARTDRYGRALAQLHGPDGSWIQGELLRRGLARVSSFADNRALVAEMLALEGEARAARRGLWANRFYRIRTPAEAKDAIDSFQLIEGTVAAVATRSGRTYVNFGADWHDDFTLTLDAAARRRFTAAGLAPDSLAGRRVRVRGWLRAENGPLIEITHPEQIELLTP